MYAMTQNIIVHIAAFMRIMSSSEYTFFILMRFLFCRLLSWWVSPFSSKALGYGCTNAPMTMSDMNVAATMMVTNVPSIGRSYQCSYSFSISQKLPLFFSSYRPKGGTHGKRKVNPAKRDAGFSLDKSSTPSGTAFAVPRLPAPDYYATEQRQAEQRLATPRF